MSNNRLINQDPISYSFLANNNRGKKSNNLAQQKEWNDFLESKVSKPLVNGPFTLKNSYQFCDYDPP